LPGDYEDICKTCLEFLSWKYKKRLRRELKRFRKAKRFIEDWRDEKIHDFDERRYEDEA